MPHFGGLWPAVALVLLQFRALSLAAPPTVRINSTDGLDLSSNSIPLTSTAISTRPPDPYQIRVDGSPTSLILHGYGSTLQQTAVLDILFQGQSAVVDGLVASRGNAPIERLAFAFWSGQLYMAIQPLPGGHMRWLMLAQAFKGTLQFMEEFEWMSIDFTVLDDEVGLVGRGSLFKHVPRGVGSNGSSLEETS